MEGYGESLMKGNPLLRLIFVLLVLSGVAWPVCRLTMQSTASISASVSPSPLTAHSSTSDAQSDTQQATLHVRVAPSPLHCSIKQGGCTLLTDSNLVAPGEYRVMAPISLGDDLLVTAEWTDGNPHALHAEVMISGHQAPLQKDYWAGRTLEDTFPIEGQPPSQLP